MCYSSFRTQKDRWKPATVSERIGKVLLRLHQDSDERKVIRQTNQRKLYGETVAFKDSPNEMLESFVSTEENTVRELEAVTQCETNR